ncbi:MAG: hypothetical protein H0V80_10110 [Acidobacteria bacterium]|nr:hypothetical protein [Acidobacteriota bacterium]
MIVYRTAGRLVDPALELSRCLAPTATGLDAQLGRLLTVGAVECAITDHAAPQVDGLDPRVHILASATRAAARVLLEVAIDGVAASASERHAQRALAACLTLSLPGTTELRSPAGFAYDGLHPLSYDAAVRQCLAQYRPDRVLVIGLRTIGATLAGLVAARCDREGIPAASLTLRPRGEPMARTVLVDADWCAAVAGERGALCLVVDEGPGPSGSSLVAAADLVERLGHPAERIVTLCSHDPEPETLRSMHAQTHWHRRPRLVALPHLAPFDEDWSSGRWRSIRCAGPAAWPAVYARHERPKGVSASAPGVLQKFVGMAAWGQPAVRRAEALADAGFSPPTSVVGNGYVCTPLLQAEQPPSRRGNARLLATLARYLPFRRGAFGTGERADVDGLLTLLRSNVRELWGSRYDAALSTAERVAAQTPPQPATIVDGRLQPWEWVATRDGLLKVDAVEHGDDHFQPGPQDCAWDVAGALSEFAWTAAERAELIATLTAALRDPGLPQRLPWMVPAYLATRVGFASMAREALADSDDGRRFARQQRRYARQLAAALEAVPTGH